MASSQKMSLTGANGAGKSTLLRLAAGILRPSSGQVVYGAGPYYIPQHFGQYDDQSIADALNVTGKLRALEAILTGNGTLTHFDILADDWTVEERCHQALADWGLQGIDLTRPLGGLSGGQKTKVFLAGLDIHQPELILLDEPSNHLDTNGRTQLYEVIANTRAAVLLVSHDRNLLDLVGTTTELNEKGLTVYGGNYSFYAGQKAIEQAALEQDIHSHERALKQAKTKAQEAIERQQKRETRGRSQQQKAGVARIMLKTYKDQAEQSTARLQGAHTEKSGQLSQNLKELRASRSAVDQLQIRFEASKVPAGKTVLEAIQLNFGYNNEKLWHEDLNFKINGCERISLTGANGSGKTTLIKLILGELTPTAGELRNAVLKPVYIDQDYSLIDKKLTIYQQAQNHNQTGLEEHVVKTRLHQCLFDQDDWDKPCSALSGGERLRLALCCLTLQQQAPDLLILDEPTNNLDMPATTMLTSAVRNYEGTLIVVSHDNRFVEEIVINRAINL